MKMDYNFVPEEEVRVVARSMPRHRDLRTPLVLLVAALIAGGLAVADRPAPPTLTVAGQLS